MLLIDGYNLLFAGGTPRDVEAARDRLLARLEVWCTQSGRRARVYFDSSHAPRRGRSPHVDIIEVDDADRAIIRDLEATGDRTEYHVVTSDRAIVEAAGRRHAAVTASADFLRALAPPAGDSEPREKSEGISAEEAKAWLRTFGMGDGTP